MRPAEILVVEGSLISRDMQQRVLASAGHRVGTARDGAAALELLGRKRFDLVIVSAALEGGAEFLGRLRGTGRFKESPVVVVASREDAGAADRALAAGARACVDREDFRADSLSPLIGRILGSERGP